MSKGLFSGFEKEHLEVFLRHAWTEQDCAPLRVEARDRLEALVGESFDALAKSFGEHGLSIERSATEPNASNEGKVAAATVGLVRDEPFRRAAQRVAENRKQSRLGSHRLELVEANPSIFARLDASGIVIGAGLPRRSVPDADVFLERMKGKAQRQRFLKLLQELPEGFILGDAQEACMPVDQLDDNVLKLALDAFKRGLGWLVVGRSYSFEDVVDRPSTLELELQVVVDSLVKLYAFLALKLSKEELSEARAGRGQRGQRGQRGRRDRKGSGGSREGGAKRGNSASRAGKHGGEKKRKPKGPPPLKRPPELADRIRVRSGTFKGRVGTVLELREGEIQVRFGVLPVWIAVSDVLVLPPRKQ